MTMWRSHSILAAGLLALLWLCFVLPAAATPKGLRSTDMGPAPITLTGFVGEKRFYGLPAYGAEPEHDQKFNALLLLMREPIHGFLSKQMKEMKLTVGSSQVTLIGDKKTMDRIRRYLGREIEVTGKLYSVEPDSAEEPTYWTYTVLDVTEVKLLPRAGGRYDW
jgi:hypothetical protein